MIYDLRDKNGGGNLWNYLLAKGAGGLLDNFINGMFQRDAEAREVNRSKKLYEAVGDVMTPQAGLPQPEAPRPEYGEEVRSFANRATRGGGLYDSYVNPANNGGWPGLWDGTPGLGEDKVPGREDFLRGLARYGATAQQAKTLTDLYMNQFETADKLGYGDSVASRVRNLPMDVRGNPVQAAQSGLVAQAYGLKPQGLWEYTAPNFSSQNVDLDDRYRNILTDPATGRQALSDYIKGVSETDRMKDTTVRRGQDTNLYIHNTPSGSSLVPNYKPFVGDDGATYAFNDKTGRFGRTNIRGPVKGQMPVKPLTPSVYNFIDKKIAEISQSVKTQDEYNNKIMMLISSNPQAQEYIIESASSPRYMWKNGMVTKPYDNPYAAGFGGGSAPAANPSQEIAEYRRLFPQVTQGLTDEQLAERLRKMRGS